MATSSPVYKIAVSLLLVCFVGCREKKEAKTEKTLTEKNPLHQGMRDALTLYASFDDDVTADFAKGDKIMFASTVGVDIEVNGQQFRLIPDELYIDAII